MMLSVEISPGDKVLAKVNCFLEPWKNIISYLPSVESPIA